MDLLNTRAIDITKMAMDGLMLRQKAITANTANVMTPDYVRKEVDFESQLKEIVQKDDLKQVIRTQNSLQYNPSAIDVATGIDNQQPQLSIQKAKYLQSDIYSDYQPQIIDDVSSGGDGYGNNVDMEKEIMDMAKVGTQYSILSNLEARAFKNLNDVVKGGG